MANQIIVQLASEKQAGQVYSQCSPSDVLRSFERLIPESLEKVFAKMQEPTLVHVEMISEAIKFLGDWTQPQLLGENRFFSSLAEKLASQKEQIEKQCTQPPEQEEDDRVTVDILKMQEEDLSQEQDRQESLLLPSPGLVDLSHLLCAVASSGLAIEQLRIKLDHVAEFENESQESIQAEIDAHLQVQRYLRQRAAKALTGSDQHNLAALENQNLQDLLRLNTLDQLISVTEALLH